MRFSSGVRGFENSAFLCGVSAGRRIGSLTQFSSFVHSSLLFSEVATGEESLLSEGLRESLSSYISLNEEAVSLDDA